MCKCLTNREADIKKKIQSDNPKKKIKDVTLQTALTFVGKISRRSYTEIYVEYENQKRKETINLFHTFCPFCGVEIEQ